MRNRCRFVLLLALQIALSVAVQAPGKTPAERRTEFAKVLQSTAAVNACPVVNAGRDTTVRVGYTFRMSASATDDSQPNTALVLEWRIVSGPSGGLEIILADAPRSLVLLKAPGDYVYEFSAFDGECTSRDSVRITILDSIPFTVLRPLSGERVERGEPYIVEWQIDPAANVLVEFSPDGGETFTRLTINSISGTRYTWHPAPGLALSDNCIIRVINYFQRAIYTDSSPFSLIDSSGGNGVIRRMSDTQHKTVVNTTRTFNARGQRIGSNGDGRGTAAQIIVTQPDNLRSEREPASVSKKVSKRTTL